MTAAEPGYVMLKSTSDWPDIFDRPDAIEINFTAGYTSLALVPKRVRQAVMLLLAHAYDNRSVLNLADIRNIERTVPFSLQYLLESLRVGGWTA
jgi:hypothetical protein